MEDGIGTHRRCLALDRAGSGLERLVLSWEERHDLTLESLAWLRAIGAGLIHLSADGHVLTHSVPFGYDGHPIRRAQALAIATGLDIDLARELIHWKLDGQRANLTGFALPIYSRSIVDARGTRSCRFNRRNAVVRGQSGCDLLERLVDGSDSLRGWDLARFPQSGRGTIRGLQF